ncbi:jg25730, partial [Pararge aegeria aegeria]
PAADLQKCPHCSRNFGMRAFERHVEWCADKAKILPAAPQQPPPHIADAKQRLNARTQYKAPLARGRRSSQTRDKSSNSRSASVESVRGVSPPREYGDYRHPRTRASESMSSNDCHEEASPHVPIIRNLRTSQNNSSGDANIKARQARLARDLSSSR